MIIVTLGPGLFSTVADGDLVFAGIDFLDACHVDCCAEPPQDSVRRFAVFDVADQLGDPTRKIGCCSVDIESLYGYFEFMPCIDLQF